MASKPVLLTDVATVAGVSLATASQALNGGGRVSPDTRKRVVEIAARLDYRPNALARSFVRGESRTIGILMERAPETFSMTILTGANRVFSAHDLATLSYDARNDPAQRRENVRRLQARRADGILVIANGTSTTFGSLSEHFTVPVVYVYGQSDDPTDASFVPDDVGAGRLAGEHLMQHGRTHIAHITASYSLGATQRARGLAQVLDAAGQRLVLESPLTGGWTKQWGAEATRHLLSSSAPFDAVFCGNDQIAIGVYGALREAGLRIPHDVALVGYDHWSQLLGIESSFLTTIDPNLPTMAANAAEHLLAAIEDRKRYTPGIHMAPCTLIPGRSSLDNGAVIPAPADGEYFELSL